MAAWWTNYIRQRSRQLGLDPAAVLAVASQEGLSGRVGDSGHAFGPFQLNDAGGVLTGRAGNHRAFAESQQGIDYALQQIAGVARGQRGAQAIGSIVSRFERPKDIPGEIARARSAYGGSPGVAQALLAASPLGQAPAGSGGQPARSALAQNLIAASQAASQGQAPDYSQTFSLVAALKQAGTAAPQSASPLAPLASLPAGARGRFTVAAGADRPGVHTVPAVKNFVAQIAALVGHPLVIGTGTNHNRMTVNGNVSDHWSGHAADIPASGNQLIRLGQAALIAAGMSPALARKQHGGLYNVGGHQVIFATNTGGNHFNHLHVSA